MRQYLEKMKRRRQIGRVAGIGAVIFGMVGIGGTVWLWQDSLDEDENVTIGLPAQLEREEAPKPTEEETTEETFPRLEIPRINTKAGIEIVGLDDNGNMAAPTTSDVIARYENSATPGGGGNSVLAGHVDTIDDARGGVFGALDKINIGDEIVYITEDEELKYRVATKDIYKYDEEPDGGVFGQEGAERLTLITCSGTWIDDQDTYQDRLVVVALAD